MNRSVHLKISGMNCDHCVGAVENAIRGVPGVRKCHVEVGSAHVELDEPAPTKADLFAAVRRAGSFDVTAFSHGGAE